MTDGQLAKTTSGSFRSIFKKMQNKKLLTPYLDLAITQSRWPDSYQIKVDSRPYYGLGDGRFHPSTHGKIYDKPRLLWYMFHPEYAAKLELEPPSLQREMTFAMGSALHAVVQTQFQMVGLCAPFDEHGQSPDIEVEYTDEARNTRGRTDFIAHHPVEGPTVCELKTMNGMSFSKIEDTVESMKPEWKIQLSMALDNLNQPWGILLVFQAGWPYRFEEIRYPRDDALLSQVYDGFAVAQEGLALDSPPEFCCSYNSPTMKSCPARFVCWLALRKA